MKKIIMLIISILLIISCADIEASRERMRQRGRECIYNKRGGLENCRYID